MKAKHAVLSLLVIVVIFVAKGFHANSVVEKDMESVYKEFDTVTNTLSPLFDTYGLAMVDTQVKASHGLISAHEYCEQLEKAVAIQKKKIKEYSEMVKGNESVDDKELFMRSTDAYIYANKMMALCKKNDIVGIHQSLYSGEMYKIIDPMTGCINRILNNKFETSETYRKNATNAIKQHTNVMLFASALTAILGIVIIRCKDCSSKKLDKKKKKVRVKRR